MPEMRLSDGARVVVLEEAQERRPRPAAGMEVLPTVEGELVVYERVGRLVEVPISGRVKTRVEVNHLERFVAEGVPLYLTDRDGTVTGGWRIKTEPPPQIRRKDGDSPDWLVELTLWRMP